jgi:hypothetical protein
MLVDGNINLGLYYLTNYLAHTVAILYNQSSADRYRYISNLVLEKHSCGAIVPARYETRQAWPGLELSYLACE